MALTDSRRPLALIHHHIPEHTREYDLGVYGWTAKGFVTIFFFFAAHFSAAFSDLPPAMKLF